MKSRIVRYQPNEGSVILESYQDVYLKSFIKLANNPVLMKSSK
jgi:hypothetical protein